MRRWRGVRGLSQLGLALAASTTSRHVSFVESGRSQPSRAMVLRLARVLDAETLALRDEALAQPGVPPEWRLPDPAHAPLPVVPVAFAKDGLALSYFSMVTTLGTPQDALLQEIRIESFFPADEVTAAHAW
jgi:transcriptional regulator with XRE-family HTH domain